MKTITRVFLAGMLLIGAAPAAVSACPEEYQLRSQYQDLSLEMSQIGFKIAQLGLPLTHPTVISLEAKYGRLRRQRDAIKEQLDSCQAM